MQKVSVSELDGSEVASADRRALSDALGTSDLAINYYALDPGEQFSGGLHTHLDQEEVFYVFEGTATFETPERTVEVGPDEGVRFAPGDYQQGRNDGDERVVALALGAPRNSSDVRVPGDCPECGEADSLAVELGPDGMAFVCPECGADVDLS